MTTHNLADRLLNELDHRRLTLLREKTAEQDIPEEFDELLDAADAVPPAAMPPDRVTLYSRIQVRASGDAAAREIVLCYPPDSDPVKGHVSVLSPLGASLLGQRVGDTAHYRAPDGSEKTVDIVEILYQPEANGELTR